MYVHSTYFKYSFQSSVINLFYFLIFHHISITSKRYNLQISRSSKIGLFFFVAISICFVCFKPTTFDKMIVVVEKCSHEKMTQPTKISKGNNRMGKTIRNEGFFYKRLLYWLQFVFSDIHIAKAKLTSGTAAHSLVSTSK